jgi:DNA polymerase III subunit delta
MAKSPAKKPPKLDAAVRIAVLHGKEQYLLREHTARLKEALTEEFGDVEVFRYDGDSAEVADVLDECRSFSLMTRSKLVVVDRAEEFVKGESRPLVERYAEHPTDGTTLVLRGETWRKGKLDKLIEAGGGVILKCEHATPSQAIGFALARCKKRYQAELDQRAAALLVERVGSDLSRIDTEVAKLALAAGVNGVITEAIVAELVGLSREEQAWQIQQEVLTGDAGRTIATLRDMHHVTRDRRSLDVVLSYAFMDLARKMTLIGASQQQGENTRALAQSIRLWGDSERLVGSAARRAGLPAIAALFDRAVDADARSKSGFGTAERAAERLAAEICAGIAG